FTGTRRPYQQYPLGSRSAKARVFSGMLQEIHDLDELILRLVYARHVLEGNTLIGLLVVTARLAFAHAECTAHGPALPGCTPLQPYIEGNDEQGRTEAEQQGAQPVAGVDRYRLDLDLV